MYVQHILYDDRELIWNEIIQKGGYIYVCGDASKMERDVRKTIISIVYWGLQNQRHSLHSTDEAAIHEYAVSYVNDLLQNGRYKRDVWF